MASPQWKVPLADVKGDEGLVAAAATAIRSGWWSSGPRVASFEEQLADFTGARHAFAVANGTAALHLALAALDIGPGDEVITPSLTFVAAANAIRLTGAVPVFCDVIGEDDLNLDPGDVSRAVTERTAAIMPLHYGGFPCSIDEILDLASASARGIAVIEDAAHAIGAVHHDRSCGSFGDIGCFSFFSNKNLPVGEGGAVIAQSDEVARRLRLLRSHGMTTMTWDRHRGHASAYDVVEVGFNYRLDEIRAAMAIYQLERLPAANAARARHADRYVEKLHDVEGIRIVFAERVDRADAAHHLAVAVLPLRVERDGVRAALTEAGVQTSVHYPPIHTFSAYADLQRRPLPRTEALAGRILTLPLYAEMTEEQHDHVTDTLLATVRRALGSDLRAGIAGDR